MIIGWNDFAHQGFLRGTAWVIAEQMSNDWLDGIEFTASLTPRQQRRVNKRLRVIIGDMLATA